MPELPEVETVKNVLLLWIKNETIDKVVVNYQKVIDKNSLEISLLNNQRIIDVRREGKFLIIETEKYILTSHLRMEGKYYLGSYEDYGNYKYVGNEDETKIKKHAHVLFFLSNKKVLIYNDVRKFGKMHLYNKLDFIDYDTLHIGKEPFDVVGKYLFDKIKNSNKPIKTILLDQQIISGLGNIYVDEVCFSSSILPTRKGKDISLKECNSIIENSKTVLSKAIKLGGSTVKTYHSGNGVDGLFQNELNVYGKENSPCTRCGTIIEKTKLGGRGTHYCPKCQK